MTGATFPPRPSTYFFGWTPLLFEHLSGEEEEIPLRGRTAASNFPAPFVLFNQISSPTKRSRQVVALSGKAFFPKKIVPCWRFPDPFIF